jgi:plastocyanin
MMPQANPNAAAPAPFNRLGRSPVGMMGFPGMSQAPPSSAGPMGSWSGMGGYAGGMPGPASQGYGGETGANAQTASEVKSLSQVLAASGVPNDGGRLQWPAGLRAVGGPEGEELRRQIDALFQQEAEQTQTGPVNRHLVKELARSVDALRKLLLRDREERFSLALTTYEDAERFLAKLDRARKTLEAGLEPPGGNVELKARAANVAEVGLYDNRFDPPALTVLAGTTVRWTNHGGHEHTVTSDRGDWNSGGVAPAGVYSYTFTRPGEYRYHCEVHPGQMRGTIVVK